MSASSLVELFDSEAKWAKRVLARDKYNMPVSNLSPYAVCWCLVGGIKKIYGINRRINDKLIEAGKALGFEKRFAIDGQVPSVSRFNDSMDTTFEDIKAVIVKAGV